MPLYFSARGLNSEKTEIKTHERAAELAKPLRGKMTLAVAQRHPQWGQPHHRDRSTTPFTCGTGRRREAPESSTRKTSRTPLNTSDSWTHHGPLGRRPPEVTGPGAEPTHSGW